MTEQLDPTEEHVELTFQDQTRWVPSYVARQLPSDPDEVFQMTYAEAMAYINQRQFSDFANRAQRKFVDSHFRDLGR